MASFPRLTFAMIRLLSAALICLALVTSQMAHAQVPGTAVAVHVDSHSSAHTHMHKQDGEKQKADHDHSGGVDSKCASHCSSAFVFGDVESLPGERRELWQPSLTAAALTGSPVPLLERPPRT